MPPNEHCLLPSSFIPAAGYNRNTGTSSWTKPSLLGQYDLAEAKRRVAAAKEGAQAAREAAAARRIVRMQEALEQAIGEAAQWERRAKRERRDHEAHVGQLEDALGKQRRAIRKLKFRLASPAFQKEAQPLTKAELAWRLKDGPVPVGHVPPEGSDGEGGGSHNQERRDSA